MPMTRTMRKLTSAVLPMAMSISYNVAIAAGHLLARNTHPGRAFRNLAAKLQVETALTDRNLVKGNSGLTAPVDSRSPSTLRRNSWVKTMRRSSHPSGSQVDSVDDASLDSVRRRYLLRRFLRSAKGFWFSDRRSTAWSLSAGLLAIILLVLGAAYAMNAWHRAMFDGLQNRDTAAVARLSLIYFAILAVSVFLSIVQVWVRMALQRRWRAWVSTHVTDRWLGNGRYYQLNLVPGDHANPEYRIADDVRIATEAPVDFVSGVTQALLSAATFIVVLWTIGGALDVSIGGVQ